MRDRLAAASGRDGWIGGQLLIPLERVNERLIVGTWDSRADWEAWHTDEAFKETRERMEGLEAHPSETTWHEVVVEQRGRA